MNIDWKAIIKPIIFGLATCLAAFGIVIPEDWQPIAVTIGVIIMSVLPSILKKKDSK